jgi:hypothetical protein
MAGRGKRACRDAPGHSGAGRSSRLRSVSDERLLAHDYVPEVRAIEAARFPSIQRIAAALGGHVEVKPAPIPLHCRDGFNEAYYGRPEALLDPEARLACSSWSLVPAAAVERFVQHLSSDLASGRWDERHGHLRAQPFFDGPLRLIIGKPA